MNKTILNHEKRLEKAKEIYKESLVNYRKSLLKEALKFANENVDKLIEKNPPCNIDFFKYCDYMEVFQNIFNKISKEKTISDIIKKAEEAYQAYTDELFYLFNYHIKATEKEITTLLENGFLETERLYTENFLLTEGMEDYTLIKAENLIKYKNYLESFKEKSANELQNMSMNVPIDFLTDNFLLLDKIFNEFFLINI